MNPSNPVDIDDALLERSALSVHALEASLRYFSNIVQTQEERLAARRHDIETLASELAQRCAELDAWTARAAALEASLRHARTPRHKRLAHRLRDRLRVLRRRLRGLPMAPERPAAAPSPTAPAGAAAYRERLRALHTNGGFQDLQRVDVLIPPALHAAGPVIARCLAGVGLEGTVHTQLPEHFSEGLYLVVDPLAFERLPPPDRCIAWLADAGDDAAALDGSGLARLSASLAIFDASLDRLQQLQRHGLPLQQVFYVPLDAADPNDAVLVDPSPMGLRYLFARALHGCGVLGHSAFEQATRATRLDADRIVLCMPESAERFRNALASTRHGAVPFPGIRQLDGWRGTALSFRHLARSALAAGRTRLVVWEDDVAFPPDFEARLPNVLEYLDVHEGTWDVFSGILTDLSEQAEVQSLAIRDHDLYVRTNTVIGMVFGIYGPKALQALSTFRLEGDNVLKHTIDRYLEALRPRCCTVFPPLVQQNDTYASTLWRRDDQRSVTNEAMNPMIQRSQRRLVAKMIRCLQSPDSRAPGG